MKDHDKRLQRVERIIGDAHCVCAKYSQAIVVIEDSFTPERVQLADQQAMFTCPTHGHRMPESILHLSHVDANL